MKNYILFFLIILNSAHSQTFIGGQFSFNRKLPLVNYTPVVPEISNSNEFGLTGIFCKNNESKFKAIITFSDDRFQDNQSIHYYNNFIGICAMVSVMNFDFSSGKKNCLLFGFYAEGLTKYGIADPGMDKFSILNNIGTNIKFGVATEYSLQMIQNKWLSSVSLFTRGDLSKLTVLNGENIIIRDELIRVGINLNLNKQLRNPYSRKK